jgi:hypothetical protein
MARSRSAMEEQPVVPVACLKPPQEGIVDPRPSLPFPDSHFMSVITSSFNRSNLQIFGPAWPAAGTVPSPVFIVSPEINRKEENAALSH